MNLTAEQCEEIKLEYVGSVSLGTLRPDDLLPKFMDLAEEMGKKLGIDTQLVDFHRAEYSRLRGTTDAEEWQGLVDEYIDIFNDIAPEGYYFGAHPGDGADFGFWKEDE